MNTKNKAIVCILISAFGFSIMNLCVKLSGDLPSIEKSFFRNLKYLLLRSAFGTVGILCNFYQNKRRIPLPLQVGDECEKNLSAGSAEEPES